MPPPISNPHDASQILLICTSLRVLHYGKQMERSLAIPYPHIKLL